jgi:hypothetical protein
MVTINVLLSGRLKIDGFGRNNPAGHDGSFRLSLADGGTVHDAIQRLGIPAERVSLAMVNALQRPKSTALNPDDRLILIPPDVAALWRAFGRQNMGAESVFDFS